MSISLQVLSIILSTVALIVTVVGFFASIYFFIEGQKLNSNAKEALSRIDERAKDLKTQVGERFDKTLSAVLGEQFDEEKARRELLESGSENTNRDGVGHSEDESHPSRSGEDSEMSTDEKANKLANSVLRYFSFRGLRYTDITDEDTEAIYNLGANHGFQLFDGKDKVLYFGFFNRHGEEKIILNLRGLLNNISIARTRFEENDNPRVQAQGSTLINRLAVEILIPEDADKQHLEEKSSEFQDEFEPVPVDFITPSELQDEVERRAEEIVA